MEVGGEYEVYTSQSSSQTVSMDLEVSKIKGEFEVQSEQSPAQEAIMPANESEDVTMTDPVLIGEQSHRQLFDEEDEVQFVGVRLNLRSANKRQEKTIKKGKASIKDNETTADIPEDGLTNIDVRLQSGQSQLEDTKKQLVAFKADLKESRAQLKIKKKELAACRGELKASKKFGRETKVKNRDLQESLTTSEKDFSECRDALFSLQTVTQVPDSTISELFESLSQQILQWIEATVVAFEKANPEAQADQILSVGGDKQARTFFRRYPDVGEHFARHLIHLFLQNNLFSKQVYFLGLPDEIAQLLRKAELKMAELDPPRSSVAIASWRSETLKALAKTTESGDYANEQAKDLNSRLFKELSKALPFMFSGTEARITFYDQVLLRAVGLANTIRMSTSDYYFSMPESPLILYKPVTTDLLKVHKMIEFKSGRPLKPDSAVVADEDGSIGDIVICLEPGLHRMIKGEETTLRQEMFLVELKHPLRKRSKTSA